MFTAGIITASDKCYACEREDLSGQVIKEILADAGYKIEKYIILPDDIKLLKQEMIYMSDLLELNLIVTTGGTGFAPRDVTPEATKLVIEKETPGISEAMRYMSLSVTPKAMLSRGISGIRKNSLIVNLPGSPKAVRETLNYILEPLEHGLNILLQKETECAR
ncbi:MAG: MogA/MoaB family molybdenum cofactor biosynthesis protein [Clostridiales bacterium]|nr:MogA/MoaB family molybdenum cofactor biosynthesis protein [Clostridiales bacterium]